VRGTAISAKGEKARKRGAAARELFFDEASHTRRAARHWRTTITFGQRPAHQVWRDKSQTRAIRALHSLASCGTVCGLDANSGAYILAMRRALSTAAITKSPLGPMPLLLRHGKQGRPAEIKYPWFWAATNPFCAAAAPLNGQSDCLSA
jgi:hypothetical protein